MITAVDTSIILDILTSDPQNLDHSLFLFRQALHEGKLIICPLVWGELRPFFNSDKEMKEVLEKMSLTFDEFGEESASMAGSLWQQYRKAKGSRQRLLGDFLIGAHALVKASRLLTRDRGFYRNYFRQLKILE